MGNWLARAQAIAPLPNDSATRCWRVCYPDVGAIEVIFTPEATRAEVSAVYPGAELEPMPDAPRRTATPTEAAELRGLVARVLADASEHDRAEALAIALGDPEAALRSFRALQVSPVFSSNNKTLPIASNGCAANLREG